MRLRYECGELNKKDLSCLASAFSGLMTLSADGSGQSTLMGVEVLQSNGDATISIACPYRNPCRCMCNYFPVYHRRRAVGVRRRGVQKCAARPACDEVARQIAQAIHEGRFLPGQTLPPARELATKFNVSRPILPEALSILQLQGYVSIRHGRGTFVKDPNTDTLNVSLHTWLTRNRTLVENFYEARLAIEPVCAARAAQMAEPTDIAELRAIVESLDHLTTVGDTAVLVSADIDFHSAIARLSRNEFLIKMLNSLIVPETDVRKIVLRAPDVMVGLLDYPETPGHPPFTMSLQVNFADGSGGSMEFRFVGDEGILTISGAGVGVSRRAPDTEPGFTIETFAEAEQKSFLEAYLKAHPEPDEVVLSESGETRYQPPRSYDDRLEHFERFVHAMRTKGRVVEDATFGYRAAAPALLCNQSYREGRTLAWDPEAMRAI